MNTIRNCIEDYYQLLEPLGKGAFGTVQKAICRETNKLVAIKIIDKKRMQNAGMVQRVQQEINIHGKMNHPSILKMFASFQDDNFVYLVLELAENGDLQRYLREHNKVMTELEAANIIKQVVDGLLYLQNNNIVHRDISLANLLLTKDMQVKIADFGLATLDQPGMKHMTLCGTPNYISPEVASRASHGLPADVWGLGCLLYTLLVGRPPFDSDAVPTTLRKVIKVDYVMPQTVSCEAADLINRCLRLDPSERIKLEDVLSHPFMRKVQKSAYSRYNNTLASSDSGMLTMSSNTSQSHTRSGSIKPSLPSSLSTKNSYDHLKPFNSPASNNPFETCSSYLSYDDNVQKSDRMLNDLQQQVLKKTFNSIELDTENKYHKEPLGEDFRFKSYNSVTSSATHNSNQYALRQPLLESQVSNVQHLSTPKFTNPMFTSTPEEIPKKKLSVPPFNTTRLLPTKHRGKTAILSIVDTGEVVIESIKFKPRYKEDRVVDVLRISKDGLTIKHYVPNNGEGTSVKDDPPDIRSDEYYMEYTYDNLRSDYWKKYGWAAKFVQMVRAKTLKVTYHTPKCKFQMMETLEDFEAFYYSGVRIIKSSLDGIKLLGHNGNTLFNSAEQICESRYQDLWMHFNECMDHCLNLESTLSKLECTGTCFPITVGRKPTVSELTVHNSLVGSKNLNLPTLSSVKPSYSCPPTRAVTPTAFLQKNQIIRKISIPNVGIAVQLTHGVMEIEYLDGSKLSVIPSNQGGGFTYSEYGGISKHYSESDELPNSLVKKIQEIPFIVEHLKLSPEISAAPSLPLQRSSSMRYMI